MSLRELTDVLTALLFYDFLVSFMLTGCDGFIESDSTLFCLLRTSKILLRLNVLIFSAISASKCYYLVLKILCSLMAPNVVIPYCTVLH